MGSYFGKEIHISIFGQSHAECIGVTIDGLPAGEAVDEEALRAFMLRRAPGRSAESTARREADEPHIICGLHNGRTCGAPLTAIIKNGDTRSKDYDKLRDLPRPGHADLTAEIKYRGFQDGRGGGHFSGRLTAPLCIAGGICAQLLARRGIETGAHILSIAGINDRRFNALGETKETIDRVKSAPFPVLDEAALGETKETLDRVKSAPFPVLDEAAGERMRGAILAAKAEGDSVGGVVECIVTGLPAGVGSPMFGGLESMLSAAIFAIPAVKGVEFGSGFGAALMRGSEHNDEITLDGGEIATRTNNAGGILGGISDGMPVIFRAAFKPTPSILKPQRTVSLSAMKEEELQITGRHDPCVVQRAVPVVEAAAAMVTLDALLERNTDKI